MTARKGYMSGELITIQELLRDPHYRAYFTKVPKLPDHYTPANMPWKLMILKPGEKAWRSKRFGTYQEAFAGLKKLLPVINNGAINCPPLSFMPPTRTVRLKGKVDSKGKPIIKTFLWKPQISADMGEHHWCPHCRRPSIFSIIGVGAKIRNGFYIPALEADIPRCIICGISANVINLRHPETAQQWDPKRAKVNA